MSTTLMMDKRLTWLFIVSRDVTEKTPGPVITRRAIDDALGAVLNACWIALMAICWASISVPDARVCISSKARAPSREAQAPSTNFGRLPLLSCSSNCTISPVGSRGSNDLTNSPAGEASRSILSLRAVCRPSFVKRAGVTAGLSRYRLLNR